MYVDVRKLRALDVPPSRARGETLPLRWMSRELAYNPDIAGIWESYQATRREMSGRYRLKPGAWNCSHRDRPHAARGLCKACYNRAALHNYLDDFPLTDSH